MVAVFLLIMAIDLDMRLCALEAKQAKAVEIPHVEVVAQK